ncbi:MAG: 50S ribosomal protein L25/general stress protein Ctc [Candidatus Omnitrophota bacterium]|nr:50S ribosomal protein L25/general stress protein Ctc [Candidatus Omnitrophota bacterium]
METVELEVKHRTGMGTSASRRLRRKGAVPAILYGHGMEPVCFEVNAKSLSKVLHTKAGENVVLQLKPEGVNLKESTCVFKHIHSNPVTDKIDHVDFMIISMTEKITVNVPLVVENGEDALGVKEGGVLDVVHHEIEVECLPANIPQSIKVDVKDLNIGDAIHLKDIAIPEGVTFTLEPEDVLVSVQAPRKEEEAVAEEEEAAEPEVIEKGKKPEEGAEGEAPKKKEDAKKAE